MDIYQHFRKEEQAFIDQVLAWKEEVEQTYQRKLTDFLDPREQYILSSVIGNHPDMNLQFFGGYEESERKRAILAPFYEEIYKEDFGIALVQSQFARKFIQINHRDVLGALMSLGMKRKKLGDIMIVEDTIQALTDEELISFLEIHLTGIKKARLQFKSVPLKFIQSSSEKWHTQEGTVSSLRLDTVLKEIYNQSRNKTSEWIQKGYVKVNYRVVENPAFQMEEGDIISVRKKGRSKLIEISGQTKKDKWRIITGILK
ncbi:RNA-binding protein YlmH, contains S4-like domain [Salinibacillus kushneri]|uniref:RNA-binding protein YlmH, contains S4-like domain n=1 Tax=Salinibacillus kushneri TaxID=237682 RepID=A0A1I0HLN8_9BACI|nr:YlmH/Sll1252 family protein [Salinibacillus kushneri]SET84940.1 RNA-binding protein YlmH, contains S4-like domain [Salinibacillus kushneri]